LPDMAAVQAYIGPDGEPIWDGSQLRMQNGVTPGGIPLLAVGDSAGLAGLRGTIWGLTLAKQTAVILDVAPGAARGSNNTFDLVLESGLSKHIHLPWTVGPYGGSLDTGSFAANASYHVHLIRRASDGAIDVLTSLSATNPVMPAGWTARRRIGAVLTNANSEIRDFRQVGGWFHFKGNPPIDVEVTQTGNIPALRTLSVPKGVKVCADLTVVIDASNAPTGGGVTFVRDPDLGALTDVTSYPASYAGIAYHDNARLPVMILNPQVWTDTAGRVATADSQQAATLLISISTQGWFDPRDEYL
jgi:hypothetical protein